MERTVDPHLLDESEEQIERTLRPRHLSDFIGQETVRSNLSVFTQAALQRGEALDHVLLYGPPGLGKTTLAQIIANEMHANFRATSAPILSKAGDLAAILTHLTPNSIFFVDEIHRLPITVEETLYAAMEDRKIDVLIGEGPSAKTLRLDLPPFTLVGATTRSGLLAQPLRERFGIPMRLQFYSPKELERIVQRAAQILQVRADEASAREIALRSRGTPRVAGRLLRRVRDFACLEPGAAADPNITLPLTQHALEQLAVDAVGLDAQDCAYLRVILEYYDGGPVGIDTLAAAMAEERDTIEDMIEPYLLQIGFIQRTPRGRMLTNLAYTHLGKRVEAS